MKTYGLIGGAILVVGILMVLTFTSGADVIAQGMEIIGQKVGPRGPGEVVAYRCTEDGQPDTPSDQRSIYEVQSGLWDPPAMWHIQTPGCEPYQVPDGQGGMRTITPVLWRSIAEVSVPSSNEQHIRLVWGIPHETGGTGPPGPQGERGEQGEQGPIGPVDPTLSGQTGTLQTEIEADRTSITRNTDLNIA